MVPLDDLLRLPDSYSVESPDDEKRGGATAAQWQERFEKAQADHAKAKAALAETQAELERTAGDSGNYQVSAPGAQAGENSPVSFAIRQKLREQRAEVEETRRALRKLEIEADIASVPDAWRISRPATK